MYILAQVLGVIATVILLGYTLMRVERKTILICAIVINILWTVHFLLLGAYTGSFCALLTALMVFCSYFKGRNRFFKTMAVPILFNIFFIIVEIVTFDGLPTIVQMLANVLLIASMWCDDEIGIKSMSIPVAALLIVYNLMYKGWSGAFCHTLSLLFCVFYVCKFYYKKRLTK